VRAALAGPPPIALADIVRSGPAAGYGPARAISAETRRIIAVWRAGTLEIAP
jgi:hypothetical protein